MELKDKAHFQEASKKGGWMPQSINCKKVKPPNSSSGIKSPKKKFYKVFYFNKGKNNSDKNM